VHLVSRVVVVGCLVLVRVVGLSGTTACLLVTVMAAVDVVAGFSGSIVAARRDMEIERIAQ
jgi:hypothetical protein